MREAGRDVAVRRGGAWEVWPEDQQGCQFRSSESDVSVWVCGCVCVCSDEEARVSQNFQIDAGTVSCQIHSLRIYVSPLLLGWRRRLSFRA